MGDPCSANEGGQHIFYLSDQVNDILEGLKFFSGGSPYVFPGRYNQTSPIVSSSLNRMVNMTIEKIREYGIDIKHFTVHDLPDCINVTA
jgi:integrase